MDVVCWGWHSVGVGRVVVWFVMLLGVWDNLLFLIVDAFDGLTECFVGVLWVFSVV